TAIELRDAVAVIESCPASCVVRVTSNGPIISCREDSSIIPEVQFWWRARALGPAGDAVMIRVDGCRRVPEADLGQRVPAIGASPKIKSADDDCVGIPGVTCPDDVGVPALVAQITHVMTA